MTAAGHTPYALTNSRSTTVSRPPLATCSGQVHQEQGHSTNTLAHRSFDTPSSQPPTYEVLTKTRTSFMHLDSTLRVLVINDDYSPAHGRTPCGPDAGQRSPAPFLRSSFNFACSFLFLSSTPQKPRCYFTGMQGYTVHYMFCTKCSSYHAKQSRYGPQILPFHQSRRHFLYMPTASSVSVADCLINRRGRPHEG
ncbi:hypothetical protein SODALDRAFT_210959 [Sodiomyces alkalinus F11]|uniref:Uncharacterized protein n=1 Tax=Sodiomyces alkalinus (strain CBS 110278 / VKM F-3762 / F11) TaxID=1314773 RepID=A0A3N2PQZ4_SODAK|nr:hypothetical protein SODALDRAFT_210959 [Sodiomyces alkalinus F11]ROT36927.1 hypothetical protein SODALDRAFT_210959 [Sodiomyces alkalinus F11]